MKRIAVLAAATLIGAGTLASPGAEARGGGAVAAGLIGGLAAGALIGAAIRADAAPAYHEPYGGARFPDRYGPDYADAPVVVRPRRVYHVDEEIEPVYAPRRIVPYERGPVGIAHRRWHDDGDFDDHDGPRFQGW